MNAAATGAPGEISCAACDAGGSGAGSLQLEVVNGPNGFQPGATYTLRASIQAPGALTGGIQIVALDAGTTIGKWVAPPSMRTLSVSSFGIPSRDYLEHSVPKSIDNNGFVSWDFDWEAPVSQGHSPVFYAAAVASNNDFTSNGDLVLQNYYSLSSLPVRWGEFDLETKANTVVLRWETLDEKHTHQFEIQRSLDGHGFETLGRLPAEGKAATYRWVDQEPLVQREIFYRIKQTDIGGQFAFSEIKRIRLEDLSDGLLNCYPSMVVAARPIHYAFRASEHGELSLELQQMDGTLVASETVTLQQGVNKGMLTTQGIKRGSYVLIFSYKNQHKAQRIIVYEQ
jgi:hypothetical protein